MEFISTKKKVFQVVAKYLGYKPIGKAGRSQHDKSKESD